MTQNNNDLIAEITQIVREYGKDKEVGLMVTVEKIKRLIQAELQKQYQRGVYIGANSVEVAEEMKWCYFEGKRQEQQRIKQAVLAIEHEDIDEDFVYKAEVLDIIEGKNKK